MTVLNRIWKSGLKKRILFLPNRTALIDQTVRGDFRHFKAAMTVIKRLGTAPEIVRAFGGKPAYDLAIRELTTYLYNIA